MASTTRSLLQNIQAKFNWAINFRVQKVPHQLEGMYLSAQTQYLLNQHSKLTDILKASLEVDRCVNNLRAVLKLSMAASTSKQFHYYQHELKPRYQAELDTAQAILEKLNQEQLR